MCCCGASLSHPVCSAPSCPEQGGSHLGSQHHFYKQQCFAGHLEQTCLSVSCFFHCQSFSSPAFCFSSLLTAEACNSLPALLSWLQPLWAALCLLCCYSTALWTCFSQMRLFNRAFIPILSRVHSAALAAFASKMPAHWLKSAATQNKPWFYVVFFFPQASWLKVLFFATLNARVVFNWIWL